MISVITAIIMLTGNLTMPTISLNGQPVNTQDAQVKQQLSNINSALSKNLTELLQPEVILFFPCAYCLVYLQYKLE